MHSNKRQKLQIPPESTTVEWKKSLSEIKEIIKSISAFSNTKGGRIFIGISREGKPIGVQIGKGTLEKLANQISQRTEPNIHPQITVRKAQGDREIIIVAVKESPDQVVLASGRPYKRVGRATVRMSREEYEKKILEIHKIEFYFDRQICKEATLKDIDEETVKKFLIKAKEERNLNLTPQMSVKEALEKLNLFVKGKLSNAAILLFGKDPQGFFLQAEIKAARFKGVKPLEFIDMKVLGKNIIEQREDAIEFIKEHIKLHAKVVGTERIETWEYPIEAIREAITNAICHRDYKNPGNVQIRIFDDRIEIWGCGPLPKPLTPEMLRKKHKSVLRNSLIGRCFFLIKYIEEWGTGTNRMIEWCKRCKLPEPLFEHISGDFVVTFRKYHITEEAMEDLPIRQRKIAEYIREHKKISRKECMELLDVSKDTAVRELSDLQKKGLLKRIGKGKNICYVFV